MKNLYLRTLIAVLLIGGIVATGWYLTPAATRAYTPRGPGQTYLALGDSLAWGFRLADRASESYPALIAQRIQQRDSGTRLVNLSVPGESAASLRGGQLRDGLSLIERERAAGRRVSPITIDIGGNDLQRAGESTQQRETALAAVRANIAATLDALRQATGGDADIAIMAYYNPYGGDPQEFNSEAYWVGRLNAAIAEEAARRGVAVADAYTPFGGGRAYTYTNIVLGDIHANKQGHAVMADAFWQALRY
ncbi:MAG: SGNH/GDSL hydrolase family protein [Chloroflexales bacterium]|nr:SGNH/GDSL hydrolase family protein [Chloroflexales bacterium]